MVTQVREEFLRIKTLSYYYPILTLLTLEKEFKIFYDAFHQGLGCFMMHEGKVIAYASRQLKLH